MRQGGRATSPQFWKTMEIRANARKNRADLSENILKSGYIIKILRIIRQTFNCPPPPENVHQPRSPMLGISKDLLDSNQLSIRVII
jgi:hypothetical protein